MRKPLSSHQPLKPDRARTAAASAPGWINLMREAQNMTQVSIDLANGEERSIRSVSFVDSAVRE